MAQNFANLTSPQFLSVFDNVLGSTTSATQGAGAIGFSPTLVYQPGTVGRQIMAAPNLDTFPGVDPTGVVDSTAALQTAFAYCFANNLPIWMPGTYLTSASIPNFHSVFKFGMGNVVRNGNAFYITPLSTQTNNLYISTSGNDSNDGLGTGQPFLTLQGMVNVLPNYGPVLAGIWVLNLAAGTYTNGVTFPAGLQSYNYIQVNGPTSALPFIPTAIVDGGSSPSTTFAFNLNGNNNVLFNNIYVKNWTAAGNGFGWVSQLFGQIQLVNCYGLNNDNHVKCQQGRIYVTGGIYNTGQIGFTLISGETHTIGYGQTGGGTVNVPVTGASGNGTTATITFSALGTPPVVGSTAVIRSVNPSGYNGVVVITASTTTSLSFASAFSGAYVSGGVFGFNFGAAGVGPLITNMTIQGILAQENATGHVDSTAVDNCGTNVDVIASSRVNANGSSFTNATIGIRYQNGCNWNNSSTTLFGNTVNEVACAGGVEIARAGLWTSEIRQPVDQVFVSQTGTTSPTTVKTYADAIQTNSFNSPVKYFRMKFSGELTGTAGTKTVVVNVGGSLVTQFVIPAANTGSYVIDVLLTAFGNSGSSQSYEATCITGPTPLPPTSGSRSISMMTGSQVPATISVTLGNAGDTLTVRKVDRLNAGGC